MFSLDAPGVSGPENLRTKADYGVLIDEYHDIGLGFDPDCHFYNSGITLTIQFGYTAGNENESWGQVKNRFKQED